MTPNFHCTITFSYQKALIHLLVVHRGTGYYPDSQGIAVRSTADMQIFWKEVVGTETTLVFSICFSIVQMLATPKHIPCLPTMVAVQSLKPSFLSFFWTLEVWYLSMV